MSIVFRRKRKRRGAVVLSRTYYGRVGGKVVNLGVSGKQVAESELVRLRRERELDMTGYGVSRGVREAAGRSLKDHIEDYIKDRTALGRSDGHIGHVKGRLERLLRECHWMFPRDMTPDGFQAWRVKQGAAPKTVNEYLNAARALCNWMVKQGRMSSNPLAKIDKSDTRGKQIERRALTVEEVGRLLEKAGKRVPYYLAAVHTGLRRGELEGLRWGDVELDAECALIRVRASTAKNRKSAMIPLHGELAAVLRELRPVGADPGELVFAGGLPRMRDMRKDFEAAGIAARDSQGRKVDFHCLRKTFDTGLQAAGVGFTTTMNLMRHSDPRLTARTYTDSTLLPQAEAVSRLPWYGIGKGTQKGTGLVVKTGPQASTGVHRPLSDGREETPGGIGESRELSACVATGTDGELVEAGGIEPPSE
jgi:integrase